MSIDIVRLRSLVAISDCGGFSKAAAVIHISQPALSQHIRLLERDLDLKLFQKYGRGVRLTPDGERVLVEARRLLSAHDEALVRLRGRRVRTLGIGSSEHAADQLLPLVLETLQEHFPNSRTKFQIGRSDAQVDAVNRGEIDLAFILNANERAVGRAIAEVPLHWYAAPGWAPPGHGEPWSLVAFEEPCGLRRRALAILAERHTEVFVSLQSTTLNGVLSGARGGFGVALLPRIGEIPAGLEERHDLPAAGTATVALVTREGVDPEIEELVTAAAATFLTGAPGLQLHMLSMSA
jgi:DNA-binding transcriptional LysR family regulator